MTLSAAAAAHLVDGQSVDDLQDLGHVLLDHSLALGLDNALTSQSLRQQADTSYIQLGARIPVQIYTRTDISHRG